MPLAILETPDGADHWPPGIETNRLARRGTGGATRNALRIDAVLQKLPAAAHAELLSLFTQRVGVDDHSIHLTSDTPPRVSRARIFSRETALAGQSQGDPGQTPDEGADQRRSPLIAMDDVDPVPSQPARRRARSRAAIADSRAAPRPRAT